MLYLIPVPIAENALHTLPEYVKDTVRRLEYFVVERAKTARAFVKFTGPLKPLQELFFEEIPQEGGLGDAEAFFKKAVAEGHDVGLLSEAGCPGVADPGAALVALAHRMGVPVKPLVGPSSLLLALMASGMNGQKFMFHGYLPAKRPELAQALKRLETMAKRDAATQLFIETPYRSAMVLDVALEALHPDTRFGVMQDLTGEQESIRVLPISAWKKQPRDLGKLPGVFLVG
jgi:16S rRNA (cytidine1402-2'-O)-methyltransferase